MIHIRFSFIAVAVIMIALGHIEQFFMLFLSVTLHELAHVAAASRFGGCVGGFNITALGEAAVIRGLERMHVWQRCLTLLAGPLANALMAIVAYGAQYWVWSKGLHQFYIFNVTICIFNLIPAFPLDGSRLMQIWLGNYAGVQRANRMITLFSRITGLLLIVPGCVQVVLYPFNISLICAGVYLWKRSRSSALTQTYEFFQAMLDKPVHLAVKGILPVKTLYMRADQPLRCIVDRFGWDTMTFVMLGGEPQRVVTETEIMEHVLHKGLTGTIGEVGIPEEEEE